MEYWSTKTHKNDPQFSSNRLGYVKKMTEMICGWPSSFVVHSRNLLLIDWKSFWIACWLICTNWIWSFVNSFSLVYVCCSTFARAFPKMPQSSSMATGQPQCFFVCWGLTSLFNNWGHVTTVPACSSGTLTNVLPHSNAMPQTKDIAPHDVTVYRHMADLSLCYPLVCVVITTFLSWQFSTMRALCGPALSSWKMKPGPTAAIPKGITSGYNEIVTQMQSQTRWHSTAIDLTSVIYFRAPQPV